MRPLDDETLSAYIDGEIPEPERAALASRIAADPDAAQRLAHMRRADALVRDAVPEPEAADDDPLAELILSGGAAPARRPTWSLARAAPAVLAVACLIVGGVTGRLTQPAANIAQDRAAGLVAGGHLARALDRQTGAGAHGLRMVVSFKTADGRFCRQFAAEDGAEGVACRRDGRWGITVLQQAAPAGPGYQMAAGGDAPAVEAAIDALGDITVLDADAERAAMRQGWR